ncbi:MAG TPA: ABC transporter ATP-binding protein [Ilumatobacteraceae bacterium]|nr:ABC transporter ATP-binding protein [Ilumatobacteraceae bacterium]
MTASTERLDSRDGAAAIDVRHLSKSFVRRHGERIVPVDDVSFTVAAGEFVVLLGPSGCGKTTLLRCIAGLEQPDQGEIRLGATTVYSSSAKVALPPERRSASVVFQSYALWPHLTVTKNVAYPLRHGGIPRDEVRARVRDVMAMVGVAHLADQHPGQLSGGQQQRVALARALTAGYDVVLFDEPLSNVDAKVREQLRVDLLAMQRDFGFAALYVTHDQTEAMELGHRIAVLRDGRIEQLATPVDVYRRPANPYVASFVGRANGFDGEVIAVDGPDVVVSSEIGRMHGTSAEGACAVGDHVHGIIRPESVQIIAPPPSQARDNEWTGQIDDIVFSGPHLNLKVTVGSRSIEVAASSASAIPSLGSQVGLRVEPANFWVLPMEADLNGNPPRPQPAVSVSP